MARREEDATVCFVLSDHVGRGRGGQDRVLADDKLFDAIGGTDLENGLDGLWGEVTTVTADNKCCTLCADGIEDGLDEVFGVMLQESVCLSWGDLSDGTRRSRTGCWNTLTLWSVWSDGFKRGEVQTSSSDPTCQVSDLQKVWWVFP